MQTTIENIRVRGYERFEANRRFEEMTDIAERLGYPIDTTIRYEMKDGAAYCVSDTVSRPFHNQTLQALLHGETAYDGDQAFEVERLRLEHEEALQVDSFGRGELGGNVLIKFSKVPDAVVEGRTSIKGYRRDLLRSFVRIYSRDQHGIQCRLFTLDHNSFTGLRAAGELLEMDLTAPSEQVFASFSLLDLSSSDDDTAFVDELVERTKLVYDDARYRETGEHSYAGSRFVDKQNAMSVIMDQPLLINQHMRAIADIVKAGRGEAALERERQNTAAAIKLVAEGVSIASNNDSSVTAAVESGNFGRECATATNGMNQAQSMENVWRHGECQVCFAKTQVGSCMVCARCAAADDRGTDLLKLREHNLRRRKVRAVLTETAMQPPAFVRPLSREALIRKQYGEHARLRTRLVVCGAVREIYHAQTNALIAVT